MDRAILIAYASHGGEPFCGVTKHFSSTTLPRGPRKFMIVMQLELPIGDSPGKQKKEEKKGVRLS